MELVQAFMSVVADFLANRRTGTLSDSCATVVKPFTDKQIAMMLVQADESPECREPLSEPCREDGFWEAAQWYLQEVLCHMVQLNPYLKFWAEVSFDFDLTDLGGFTEAVREYVVQIPTHKTSDGEVPMSVYAAAQAVLDGWVWKDGELQDLFSQVRTNPGVILPAEAADYDGVEPNLAWIALGVTQIIQRDPALADV